MFYNVNKTFLFKISCNYNVFFKKFTLMILYLKKKKKPV